MSQVGKPRCQAKDPRSNLGDNLFQCRKRAIKGEKFCKGHLEKND